MNDYIDREELLKHTMSDQCPNEYYEYKEGWNDALNTVYKQIPSVFDGMTNKEIISEFVERDNSFAIMVDEVNGTVNIELSLDFWNAPYKEHHEHYDNLYNCRNCKFRNHCISRKIVEQCSTPYCETFELEDEE